MQTDTLRCSRVSRRLLMSNIAWLRCQHPQAFCTLSALQQSHYDVLGVKNNCTPTELKEQFIRLSKEFHPDTNPECGEGHKRFVAINEAYSVLSKPQLRQVYDAELLHRSRVTMHTYGDIRTNAPMDRVVFRDDSLWEQRDKTEFYKNRDKPIYGVKGIKKLPNSFIAAGAVVFMMVGAMFHLFLTKTSSEFATKQLNLRDQIASQHHSEVRNRARANGNTMQLELLRQKNEKENSNR